MQTNLNRRQMLAATGGVLAAGFTASTSAVAAPTRTRSAAEPFGYCFNTSTIRGQKLGIVEQIDLTSQAGYDSIEPWMRDIDEYVKNGGSLADLKKRIQDSGLTVESAIGFAQWIVDDDAKRKEGLEQAKRDMDTLRQIGGIRIAAPPTGATNQTDLNLFEAAKRYRALLELGDQMGVIPQVEVWGFSKSLSRLGESMFVAIESGHPEACLLPDVYHIYKGGSDFEGLGLLSGSAIQVFHVNDYPADPPRETINDSHRVYPGDGVAPLSDIFRMIYRAGFRGSLSLELFNRDYWQQDALVVAQTGLRKTREAVLKAKLAQLSKAD
ncbi:MAG: sugar phosphate isomerase/epimerase [Planctomycetaceae bacterium]|nr:sugar phosphate isomerase/epimerase [Planctomycetaceae bacterium]